MDDTDQFLLQYYLLGIIYYTKDRKNLFDVVDLAPQGLSARSGKHAQPSWAPRCAVPCSPVGSWSELS